MMKKLYYSIGEVSDLTGVEAHVLRYWETIFDNLSPKKNRSGNRNYSDEDLTLIFRLKELIHEKKYSTAGAKKFLEEENSHQPANSSGLSAEVRRDLEELRSFLSTLSEKI
jgi:DNA-binding transcriptional MerR regulator